MQYPVWIQCRWPFRHKENYINRIKEEEVIGKYLEKNRGLVLAGAVLTAAAVPCAYQARGYWAVGGEWLILPVILAAAAVAEIVLQDMPVVVNFNTGREGDAHEET